MRYTGIAGNTFTGVTRAQGVGTVTRDAVGADPDRVDRSALHGLHRVAPALGDMTEQHP